MARGYKNINAVHESDLEGFLSKIGLLDNFHEAKTKCKFCKDVVNLENIYSVIKDSDQYKLICNKASCVAALMVYLEDKRRGKISNG